MRELRSTKCKGDNSTCTASSSKESFWSHDMTTVIYCLQSTLVVSICKSSWKLGSSLCMHVDTWCIYIYICTLYIYIYILYVWIYTHMYHIIFIYIYTLLNIWKLRLSVSYAAMRFAIRDVSFNIPAGQFVALVGDSGCGRGSQTLGFFLLDIHGAFGSSTWRSTPRSFCNSP